MARPVPDGFRRVRALSARTHFVLGHGQVHFDPDSSKFETRNPALPEEQIELLVGRGWVADDLEEADVADADAATATDAPKPRRASGKAKSAGAAKANGKAKPQGEAAPTTTADDDQAPAA